MSAPHIEVPVHKVAKTLFHVDVNTKASQTDAMHARCTVPDTIRMLLGQLLAIHDVAANQVSEVYKLYTDGDVSHATSPQTAQRCLIEASLTALELFVLEEIHGCKDLVLGLDGTSTYFGRAFNEFHISGKTETELIGLLDCVGKNRTNYASAHRHASTQPTGSGKQCFAIHARAFSNRSAPVGFLWKPTSGCASRILKIGCMDITKNMLLILENWLGPWTRTLS